MIKDRKERRELTRPREIHSSVGWQWVGALFDTTGSVDLGLRVSTYKENIYFNMVPRLALVDKDTSKLESLQNLYGGNINGNKWSLGGETMIWILKNSRIYMPSRKPTVEKIMIWGRSIDMTSDNKTKKRDKEKAIEEFFTERALALEKERFDDLDGCYDSLILFPGFTAGALDGGASFRTKKKKGESKTYIHLELDSSNLPLLYAFQNKFGGSIEIVPKGTKGKINGKEFITKRDSGKWELAHYDLIELLKFAGPHMFLKRDAVINCLIRAGIDPSTILGYNSRT